MKKTRAELISQYYTFIVHAIEGKYGEFSGADIVSTLGEALDLCDSAENLSDLSRISRPIVSPRDDVINQVVVLIAISRFPGDPEMNDAPLETLHRLAYGSDHSLTVRSTKVVEGYPSPIPTELSEAKARFSELQGLVVNLARMPSPTVTVAAYLMAHVFSAIIRIHYFADGNGRAARFVAQYLSSTWGFGFLNIPKVRNDPLWKSALGDAIAGDINGLGSQMSKRLGQKEMSK